MRRLRQQLTYSNVTASIALFVALSGVAVATATLPRNSVGTNQLKHGAVTTGKIRNYAVRSGKLAKGSVLTSRLADNAVNSRKLGYHAVQNLNLDSGAVTGDKLASGAVDTANLADGSVTADKLAEGVLGPRSPLPSGYTERGQLDIGGNSTFEREGISYPIELGFLPEGEILWVGESTPNCPGRTFNNHGQQTPEASPGHVCVYIALVQGEGGNLAFDVSSNTALGVTLTATFSAPSPANRILAFWAVTAP